MAVADPSALNDSLRRLHRSAIVSLALCAVGIGIVVIASDAPAPEADPGRYSLPALALAALAILTRRSAVGPRSSLRAFVYGSVVSMLGAVGLGLLGLFVTLRDQQATLGLLYALAGALLVLRPPPVLRPPADEESDGEARS